jgi:hypothetical protein
MPEVWYAASYITEHPKLLDASIQTILATVIWCMGFLEPYRQNSNVSDNRITVCQYVVQFYHMYLYLLFPVFNDQDVMQIICTTKQMNSIIYTEPWLQGEWARCLVTARDFSFSKESRILGNTQPPTDWLSGINLLRHEGEVKNVWNYTAPPFPFKVGPLIMHRDNPTSKNSYTAPSCM